MANYLITYCFLFCSSISLQNKYQSEPPIEPMYAYMILFCFCVYTAVSTYYNARILKKIHEIKRRDGYEYDPTDIRYDNDKTLMKIIASCFVAGTLGGIVGIAGGIILGPLFLSMGLLPTVVSATN